MSYLLLLTLVPGFAASYWLIKRYRQSLLGQQLLNRLFAQKEKNPGRDLSISLHKEKIKNTLNALKASQLGWGYGKHAALYALPWYLVIGEPGAGKTTLLNNANLNFPLNSLSQKIAGFAGTRDCDWWISNEVILLDTAGRYLSDQNSQQQWLDFLNLLARYRRKIPVNGILVVIDVTQLMRDSEEQLLDQFKNKISEIYQAFTLRVPIYFVLSKCDLIDGFATLFEDESSLASTWSLDLNQQGYHNGMLYRKVIERLLAVSPVQGLALLSFPEKIQAVLAKLERLIAQLATKNHYLEQPDLRQVFLTAIVDQKSYFVAGIFKQHLLSEKREIYATRSRLARDNKMAWSLRLLMMASLVLAVFVVISSLTARGKVLRASINLAIKEKSSDLLNQKSMFEKIIGLQKQSEIVAKYFFVKKIKRGLLLALSDQIKQLPCGQQEACLNYYLRSNRQPLLSLFVWQRQINPLLNALGYYFDLTEQQKKYLVSFAVLQLINHGEKPKGFSAVWDRLQGVNQLLSSLCLEYSFLCGSEFFDKDKTNHLLKNKNFREDYQKIIKSALEHADSSTELMFTEFSTRYYLELPNYSRLALLQLLQSPLVTIKQNNLYRQQTALNQRWQKTIVGFYALHLKNNYPFFSAGEDVDLSQLHKLLHPKQGLLTEFNQDLAKHELGPEDNHSFLTRKIQCLQKLSHLFFPNGQGFLPIHWRIMVKPSTEISEVIWQFNKEKIRYRNQEATWQQLDFSTAPKVCTLEVFGKQHQRPIRLSFLGNWALWRMLASGDIQYLGGRRYLFSITLTKNKPKPLRAQLIIEPVAADALLHWFKTSRSIKQLGAIDD